MVAASTIAAATSALVLLDSRPRRKVSSSHGSVLAATRYVPPGGSWASGAAMRVAPVAVAFYRGPENVARAAALHAEVTGHTHAGCDGAIVQALAGREALEFGAAHRAIAPAVFTDALLHCNGAAYDDALRWIGAHADARPDEAAERLGTSGRATEPVPIAIWAFLSRAQDAEAAIVRAVNAGDDTDTISAMTGTLAGAYLGATALPSRWLDVLGNGKYSRDYALGLAKRLLENG